MTAFIVPQGKYKFTVSPMGSKPSGDYFGINTKALTEGKIQRTSVDDTLGGASDAGLLEPYDQKKKIYVETDASRSRMGYVLYQIEAENSTREEKIIRVTSKSEDNKPEEDEAEEEEYK